MHIIDTFILGIIEGFTEFLPVSSTAHLLVAGKLLEIPATHFFKTFIISIQLGAIAAIIFLYTKRILSNRHLVKKTIVAFIPTAVVGFLLYKVITTFLFENFSIIGWALIIGGIFILWFEYINRANTHLNENTDISVLTYRQSFFIGLAQALAVIPGVSRSGASIIGGMIMKIPRKTIVEFSFLLGIPTIAAASGYDLLKTDVTLAGNELIILICGFLFSFLAALACVRFFIRFIEQHSFAVFGYYRIIAGILILVFLV